MAVEHVTIHRVCVDRSEGWLCSNWPWKEVGRARKSLAGAGRALKGFEGSISAQKARGQTPFGRNGTRNALQTPETPGRHRQHLDARTSVWKRAEGRTLEGGAWKGHEAPGRMSKGPRSIQMETGLRDRPPAHRAHNKIRRSGTPLTPKKERARRLQGPMAPGAPRRLQKRPKGCHPGSSLHFQALLGPSRPLSALLGAFGPFQTLPGPCALPGASGRFRARKRPEARRGPEASGRAPKRPEGSRGAWRDPEASGSAPKRPEGPRGAWNGPQGPGSAGKSLEGPGMARKRLAERGRVQNWRTEAGSPLREKAGDLEGPIRAWKCREELGRSRNCPEALGRARKGPKLAGRKGQPFR